VVIKLMCSKHISLAFYHYVYGCTFEIFVCGESDVGHVSVLMVSGD
jgi:hypothetical protein